MDYQNIVDLEKSCYSKQSYPSSALTAATSSSSQSIQREFSHYQTNIGSSSSKNYNNFNNNFNNLNNCNYSNRTENSNYNNNHNTNSGRNINSNFEAYDTNDNNINYEPDPSIQKGIILYCFSFVSGLTIISAVLVTFTQFISILYKLDILLFDDSSSNSSSDNISSNNNNVLIPTKHISYLRMCLQLYDIGFCIYIFLAEMNFDLFKQSFIIQNWFSRGLIYIFISLLIFDDIDTVRVWRRIMDISGMMLLSMGIIYLLMSVLCLKKIRDQKMARYIQLLANHEIQQVTNSHFGALPM